MSSSLVQQLSYIVPAISITFLFVITSINVYFKIRRNFAASVNCWFCNANTKVPYIESNCWTCPSCEQYNGFTPDGDYNCDIPSQRNSKLNRPTNAGVRSLNGSIDGASRIFSTPPSNGLCQPCNRNQELKMQQLASFAPENEAYFDEEVEDFRQKLEQAYCLCPRCERHLKRALNNVKKNILGSKLTQLGAKGLHAFDLHFSAAKSDEKILRRRQLFVNICLFTLVVISSLTAYQTTAAIDINKAKLDAVFNPPTTAIILLVASYMSACKILVSKLFDSFVSLPYVAAAFAVWRHGISYLYAGLGKTVWNSVLTELNQLCDGYFSDTAPDVVKILTGDRPKIEDIANEIVIANVSGCLLSLFVIFTAGFQFSSMFSLILWTGNILLSTQIRSSVPTVLAVAIDATSILVIWTSTIVSIWNFVRLPVINETTVKTENQNSSFHRIYSDCESDVSEESDAESELNTSLQSNRSIRSIRSGRHSLRNTLNSSFVSQAPSVYSSSTYAVKKPHRTSMHNPSQSNHFDNNSIRASHMDLTRDLYDGNQSVYSTAAGSIFNNFGRDLRTPASLAGSVNQLYTRDETAFIDRCSSRLSMNDHPDEFESGITQLSIRGLTKSRDNYRNSNRNQMNEPAPFAFRQRKTLLLPARLSYHENNQQDGSIAANQSSWLAGGYWNNTTSPQKRQQSATTGWYKANDIFPIISRTSSQSSGFESMKNCADSTPQHLYDDNEIDGLSMLSDRASIARNRTNMNYMTNAPSSCANNLSAKIEENKLFKNQLRYPGMDKNQLMQSANRSAQSLNKASSFDTATLRQNLPFPSYGNGTTSFAKYPKNWAKLNSDLIAFQGNLLKIKETNCNESSSNSPSAMPFIDKNDCFDDNN